MGCFTKITFDSNEQELSLRTTAFEWVPSFVVEPGLDHVRLIQRRLVLPVVVNHNTEGFPAYHKYKTLDYTVRLVRSAGVNQSTLVGIVRKVFMEGESGEPLNKSLGRIATSNLIARKFCHIFLLGEI